MGARFARLPNQCLLAPGVISAAVIFWVGGFDILYAAQDVDFDRQRQLRSVPARWGIERALRVALLSHVGTVLCLFALWYVARLGPVFLTGIILISLLLAYEHWLVRPDDLTRVNVAFFQVNAVISIGLLAVGIVDVWLTGGP